MEPKALATILVITGIIGLAISIVGFVFPNGDRTIGMLSVIMVSSAIILGSGTIANAVSKEAK